VDPGPARCLQPGARAACSSADGAGDHSTADHGYHSSSSPGCHPTAAGPSACTRRTPAGA
ncbi:MAG TPA: hypothetical protein VGT42_03560, partial [Gammaproteobacteria bacterium]|nr:hypothetical protein [Gammaproteobacteria bacterium]